MNALRAGQRLLIDRDTLTLGAQLRSGPQIDPRRNPIEGGGEEEWLLQAIERRFALRPVYRGSGRADRRRALGARELSGHRLGGQDHVVGGQPPHPRRALEQPLERGRHGQRTAAG